MVKGFPYLLVVHCRITSAALSEQQQAELLTGLRRALAVSGVEAGDSTTEVLLFNFDQPLNAITVLFEYLERIKKKLQWRDTDGALPLQYILHLESKDEASPSFRHAASPLWEQLAPETLYLSPALGRQWQQLAAQGERSLPPHKLGDGGQGLTILRFDKPSSLRRQRLFPLRGQLARLGGGANCFYCGLRTHAPANCPSRQLSMGNFSLPDVGYQPLPTLTKNLKAAFGRYQQMISLLGPGVELAQIRKNPPLQAFIAFFDILAVYQPRYLARVAFSIHSVWSGLNTKVRTKLENRNLQLGLDCLRVGQLDQARSLFLAENQTLGGKQYCATVGLAFVALEKDRFEEMGNHLQMAASLAEVEKEKIHIALLLARYHDLAGNLWKAEQALQSMASLYVDCHEIVYRRAQTAVSSGLSGQALPALGALAESSRLYCLTMLLDPVMLPMEGLLDNLLAHQLWLVEKRADEAMEQANQEYERLSAWIDSEEDEEFSHNLESLEKLRQQLEKRSYFDLFDVAEKARALRLAGPRLQETKLDSLNEEIDQVALGWEKIHDFWQDYPYKGFWPQMEERLRGTRRLLVDARREAAKSLRQGRQKLNTARARLKAVNARVARMQRLQLVMDGLRIFVGRLVVAEMVVSVLLLISYPAITIGLAGQLGPETVELVREPAVQKKVLFVANLLVAPAIAFAQTVARLTR